MFSSTWTVFLSAAQAFISSIEALDASSILRISIISLIFCTAVSKADRFNFPGLMYCLGEDKVGVLKNLPGLIY